MDEQTTTDASVATGVETTQPGAVETAEAVQETTETTQASTEASTEPSEDEELSTWATNKGVELDSDNAKKLAKMAREAEKAMHSKARKASELEKTLTTTSDDIAEEVAANTGQDPELIKRLQRVEVKEAVRDFYSANPDASNYETQMIEELQKRPHLAGDLEALYALVKSHDAGSVKSQAKKEALQTLAQKQQAAVPRGNAVSASNMGRTQITRDNVDQVVAGMSLEEYQQRLPEINKALAAR